MKQLRRLLETVIAFAFCNVALGAYYAIAQDAVVVGRDYGGMAILITALGTMVATLITSIGALVLTFRGSAKIDKANEKIEQVHTLANGLNDRLERVAKEAGHDAGMLAGVAQQVAAEALVAKGAAAASAAAPAQPLPVTVANPTPVPVVETKK